MYQQHWKYSQFLLKCRIHPIKAGGLACRRRSADHERRTKYNLLPLLLVLVSSRDWSHFDFSTQFYCSFSFLLFNVTLQVKRFQLHFSLTQLITKYCCRLWIYYLELSRQVQLSLKHAGLILTHQNSHLHKSITLRP